MREVRSLRTEGSLSRYVARGATLLLVGCLMGCSESPYEPLPKTVTYEPADEVPTQKHSTTYQPVDVVETNQPNSSAESNEPVQAGDN